MFSQACKFLLLLMQLSMLLLLAVLLTPLLSRLLVAVLEHLAVRQGPHRIGMGRAATRQSIICLTVGMQVLLYPGKHISHAPSEPNHTSTSITPSGGRDFDYLVFFLNIFSWQKYFSNSDIKIEKEMSIIYHKNKCISLTYRTRT